MTPNPGRTARHGGGLARLRSAVPFALLGIALVATPVPTLAASPAAEGAGGRRLRVWVDEDPPFVERQGERWSGWAVDLWAETARVAGLDWDIAGAGSPDEIVAAVAEGRADVALGDVAVTRDRASRVDFTQPYFHSGTRILVRSDRAASVRAALATLATGPHGELLLGVIALLGGMSALVYVLARRHDAENFPPGRAEGVTEAVYVAASALLQGQLNRRLLPGVPGRLLTLLWMIFGTVLVAYVTGAVASALTVHRLRDEIRGVDDLVHRRVAAEAGHQAAAWLSRHGVDVVAEPDLDAAVDALLAGEVEAVVHDSPVLARWIATHPGARVEEVGTPFDFKDYAIVLPQGSALRPRLNLTLLGLRESGFFAELDRRWLGKSAR